jgi:hypothetical protein
MVASIMIMVIVQLLLEGLAISIVALIAGTGWPSQGAVGVSDVRVWRTVATLMKYFRLTI